MTAIAEFPLILDGTRDDTNVDDPGHWCNAWMVKQDDGSPLALWHALEVMVRERRFVRRGSGRLGVEIWPGFRFMDGSGIVMLPDGAYRVSPDGTSHAGHIDWMEE